MLQKACKQGGLNSKHVRYPIVAICLVLPWSSVFQWCLVFQSSLVFQWHLVFQRHSILNKTVAILSKTIQNPNKMVAILLQISNGSVQEFLPLILYEKVLFLGIKPLTSILVQTLKNHFFAKFSTKFVAFSSFFSFFAQKTLKK